MPRRLDFAPFRTHYFFLITTVLAIIGWFLAFIGQAISTAQFGNRFVSVLWFAILLQAFINLGVIAAVATDSVQTGRIQLAVFSAIAAVFAVQGVDAGIFPGGNFTPRPALNTMGAGYFLLTTVNLLWVLYFTSEEESAALHLVNRLGTGGLTPPARRRRTRGPSVASSAAKPNYALGAGISSLDLSREPKVGLTRSGTGRTSLARSATGRSSRKSLVGSIRGVMSEPTSPVDVVPPMPLMPQGPRMPQIPTSQPPEPPVSPRPRPLPAAGALAGTPDVLSAEAVHRMELVLFNAGFGDKPAPLDDGAAVGAPLRAKALHAYTGSPDDPNELSFAKGEILEIEDQEGKWWEAKKSDGTLGIVPSNYLVMI
ncbi:hypothetical protein C8R43DRAFT_1097936 [Mycena crocata]|nr:hypothetical protein C8R43DRAFT_1097936 [Mycena crocata]